MLKNISLKEMFENEVNRILNSEDAGIYYWKDGNGKYHEIIECDLFRGRFKTDNDDFSEFNWELEESRIYVEEVMGC